MIDATGAESCKRCGEEARSERDRLQAENDKLRVELTDLRLKSCPSCGIKVENEKLRDQLEEQKCFAADLERDVRALREMAADMLRDFANADYELKARHGRTFMAVARYEPRLRELGVKL